MACSCKNKRSLKVDSPEDTLPEEPCAFCAEKHLATAMQLANECGYENINRQRIIGELTLSQWHIYRTNYHAAELMRDIRHLVQQRKDDQITQEMWKNACEAIEKDIDEALKADAESNVNA